METQHFVGPLLRMLRLQRNWSQETLCHGICAVSYLSKIEKGKADANQQLLEELFARLGVVWQATAEAETLSERLYEGIFSWDDNYTREQMQLLEENWEQTAISPYYIDFIVIRAYYYKKAEWIPDDMNPLLNSRQRALAAITRNQHKEAYRVYPCSLTAYCLGEEAYYNGNYTQALEFFQISYDQASQKGYVYLMMYAQHIMSNCYSDMGNIDAMYRHGEIASRLGRVLGDMELVDTVDYNIASTKAEFGHYEDAYHYFSNLKNPNVMALHKLAICCEALGRKEQALVALEYADQQNTDNILYKEMCNVVRYRLEHTDYLHDPIYGSLLMDTFKKIRAELHPGYARFHLRWVTEWLTANRLYRSAYEIVQNFPMNTNLDTV